MKYNEMEQNIMTYNIVPLFGFEYNNAIERSEMK
jgi:hypothetical protein